MNSWYASICAGSFSLGSASRSWMPRRTLETVTFGVQPFSSLRIERQTVPEGNTLTWKNPSSNLARGGLDGYSGGKMRVMGYMPPAKRPLPGIPQSQFMKSRLPS
eukprot:Amastigsp_a677948_407.p2 type:complete len:105 gc:universal Amastigsp_a677948_407:270-584(+)